MAALEVSKDLASTIYREAQNRGLSIEDYLRLTVRRERTFAERRKIEDEQQWWLSQPLEVRRQFEGMFVAVHEHALLDYDRDRSALLKRVNAEYPETAILIMPAEGPETIRIKN